MQQCLTYLAECRHLRGASTDIFVSDCLGDVIAFEPDGHALTWHRRLENHIETYRQRRQRGTITQRYTMLLRSQREQAIERAGIEKHPP